jgi:hypothetical protein
MDDSFDHHPRQTQNHLLMVFGDKTQFQILWLCVFISSKGAGYKHLKIPKIFKFCPLLVQSSVVRENGLWLLYTPRISTVTNRNKEEDRKFHDPAHPEFQFFLSEHYDAAKPKTLKLLKF